MAKKATPKKRAVARRRAAPPKARSKKNPQGGSPSAPRPVSRSTVDPATASSLEDAPAFEPGSARWIAYEEVVHKLESTFDVRIDDIHRRLDKQGLKGHRFGDLLEAVVTLTGLPAFYAGMVVRSYPGYDTDDRDATSLRAFLRARRGA